jgi:hypothetical protein
MLCTYDIGDFPDSQVLMGKNENNFSPSKGLINTGLGRFPFTNKKNHPNQPVAK